MRGVGRRVQRADVVGGGVVGNPELSLRLVLVADVAHPQRGAERLVESASSEFGKRMWCGAEEGAADCRRRPEQQRHEPSAAVEVAHQGEVPLGGERLEAFSFAPLHLAERGPERPGQGEVEVHAGDDLHHPAVAMAQPAPVHVLHRADVGVAVARDGNGAVAGDHARHARRPQHFVANQRIGELVKVPEDAGRLAHAAIRGCHELEQRLGEIGGDGGVGEGGAERCRVGSLGDVAGAVDAQTLFLHPDPPSRERVRTERLDETAQALLNGAGQVEDLRGWTTAGTASADSARSRSRLHRRPDAVRSTSAAHRSTRPGAYADVMARAGRHSMPDGASLIRPTELVPAPRPRSSSTPCFPVRPRGERSPMRAFGRGYGGPVISYTLR